MGKFKRMKSPPLITSKSRDKIFGKESHPVTKEESDDANRAIALKMIQRFQYRDWMEPYLTQEEIEQCHLTQNNFA